MRTHVWVSLMKKLLYLGEAFYQSATTVSVRSVCGSKVMVALQPILFIFFYQWSPLFIHMNLQRFYRENSSREPKLPLV